MKAKTKIIGDAGTGKTTYIVKLASNTNATVVSHTRAAVQSVLSKAKQKNLRVKALTLHSLACRLPEIKPFLKNTQKLGGVDAIRQAFVLKHNLTSEQAEAFFNFYSYVVNVGYPRGEIDLEESKRKQERAPINARFDLKLLEEYEVFKVRRRVVDFEDMLKFLYDAVKEGYRPCTIGVVDEGQDSSPLQWEIEKSFDRLLVSGDNLQAIYSFQGSVPKLFNSFGDRVRVLKYNYRIPRTLWEFAGEIVKGQLDRERAVAIHEGGEVKLTDELTVKEVAELARNEKGERILVVARYNSLVDELYAALKALDLDVGRPSEYGNNRVTVGTIHSCKGYEGDTVILVDAVKENWESKEEKEEEERVWYVGATRAKKKLVITPLAGWEHFVVPVAEAVC